MIVNDFRGLHLATLWGAKKLNKGALFPRDSQEGPWEGFGTHFRWIWELCLCIYDIIFDVVWVEF